MLGLDMLDVAIGVVFVYLLLSLIASAAAEVWESLLKRRAVFLERGLKELLRDPDLVKDLYNHPLINGLYEGVYGGDSKDKPKLPSYIPARSFALAMMDLLLSSEGTTPPPSVPGTTPSPDAAGTTPSADAAGTTPSPDAAGTPQAVPAQRKTVQTANIKMRPVEAPQQFATNSQEPSKDQLINQARRAVVLLTKAAGSDAEQARKNIEDWYNNGMDRVSGWYKRYTQRFLFVIGLTVAIVLNVDSIRVVTALSTDKPKRDAIVGIATAYQKEHSTPPASTPTDTTGAAKTQAPAVPDKKKDAAGVVKPAGSGTPATTSSARTKPATSSQPATTATETTGTATPPVSSAGGAPGTTPGGSDSAAKQSPVSPPDNSVAAAEAQTKSALGELDKLGLPIGWKNYGCALCESTTTAPCPDPIDPSLGFWNSIPSKLGHSHWLRCWSLVLVGWLITALAISLGAPFWFDMLNKIMVVRSTVKPQEKSGTEASKDPQKK